MHVLIIKTSSLGDVIHTLPAVTDACAAIPDIQFDWVVEEAFAPIPGWHSAIDQVIPVALRRWRKSPVSAQTRQQWAAFKQRIKAVKYDLVIDAQGLLKSAALARMANGTRHGFNRRSAREGLASISYDQGHQINKKQHAIDRLRQLFAEVLDYTVPDGLPDFGLVKQDREQDFRQLVFLHGTTWPSKHWPQSYWQDLLDFATKNKFQVQLPWGNDEEKARAEKLSANNARAHVCPTMDLNSLSSLLASSAGAVAVDTGLGHLAAALSLPTVSIYGSTDPSLTGTRGNNQSQLQVNFECAPCLKRQCKYTQASVVKPACYQTVQPAQVWHDLQQLMTSGNS